MNGWLTLLNAHPTLLSAEDPSTPPQHPTQLLVSRENELILGLPHQLDSTLLRLLNLSTFKKTCSDLLSSSSNEDTLETLARRAAAGGAEVQELLPAIPFRGSAMRLNSNGKLLAVSGEEEVVVVVLPMQAKYMGGRGVNAKWYKIGEGYYFKGSGNRVVKVDWHPLSESGAHLMVLSSDGMLRMYDTSKNPEEPEKTLSFTGFDDEADLFSLPSTNPGNGGSPSKSKIRKKNSKGVFGIDLDANEVVSFSVGNNDEGWSRFTVYGLMKNGDVYAFTPFVPSKCLVDVQHLHSLKDANESEWKHSDPLDEPKERMYYWRNRWLEEMIHASTPSIFAEGLCVVSHLPKSVSKLKVERQGPVLVKGCLEDGFLEAVDFVVVETGVVGVFVLGYKNGVVQVCVEVQPPVGVWRLGEMPELEAPVVCTVEYIHLQPLTDIQSIKTNDATGGATNGISIIKDPKYNDTIYIQHKSGLHSICFEPWLSQLDELFAKQEGVDLKNALAGLKASRLEWLVNVVGDSKNAKSGMLGTAVVTDLSVGYNYFVMTWNPSQIYGNTLSIRPPTRPNLKSKESSTTVSSTTASFDRILSEPFEIPEALQRNSSRQPFIISKTANQSNTYPDMVDADTLRMLSSKVAEIRKEIADVKAAGLVVSHRHQDQILELEKQVETVNMLKQKLSGEILVRQARLEELSKRLRRQQDNLSRRMEIALQIVVDCAQPELTEEEMEWSDELQSVRVRLRSKYGPELVKLSKRIQELSSMQSKLVITPSSSTSTTLARLGSSQMRRINQVLVNEYKVISDSWSRYNELEKEVNGII
ncbi:hypothetical protein HDV05_007372 [Chytridiales sp. JEL 0842]|nr:hypothetical protein HDV05_007372 [Chytridiales sp. JEL 0842]